MIFSNIFLKKNPFLKGKKQKPFIPFIIYFLLYVFAVYIFMHVSLQTVGSKHRVSFQYAFPLKGQTLYPLNEKRNEPQTAHPIVFHTDDHPENFDVFFLGADGSLENQLQIPKNSGYITYPWDASFFLWYPRLGSHAKLYSRSGEMLWEVSESRYLKVSRDGNYIVAFSGDQSRVEFLRPDMSSIIAVEGFLLHSYEFATGGSEDTEYQACLGFLNGDIVLVNLEKREKNRIRLKRPLKALTCDFKNGILTAQIETKKKPDQEKGSRKDHTVEGQTHDALVQLAFDSFLSEKDHLSDAPHFSHKVNLPKKFVVSLPLASFGDHLVSVLPLESHRLQIQLFNSDSEISKGYLWPEDTSPDLLGLQEFRIQTTDDVLIISNRNLVVLLDQGGIIFKQHFPEIRQVFVEKGALFVQTKERLIFLKVYDLST